MNRIACASSSATTDARHGKYRIERRLAGRDLSMPRWAMCSLILLISMNEAIGQTRRLSCEDGFHPRRTPQFSQQDRLHMIACKVHVPPAAVRPPTLDSMDDKAAWNALSCFAALCRDVSEIRTCRTKLAFLDEVRKYRCVPAKAP